jgi:hypothetical protein
VDVLLLLLLPHTSTQAGLSSQGASLEDLNQALKQLNDATACLVNKMLSGICCIAATAPESFIIDVAGIINQGVSKLQQVQRCEACGASTGCAPRV